MTNKFKRNQSSKGISLAGIGAALNAVTETQQDPAPAATQQSEVEQPATPATPRILDDLSQQSATSSTATAPEGKKEEAAKQPKGPTKKGRVADMCRTEKGVTIDAIASELGIGKVAARSLIGDLRHMGITVLQDKGVYTIRDTAK